MKYFISALYEILQLNRKYHADFIFKQFTLTKDVINMDWTAHALLVYFWS